MNHQITLYLTRESERIQELIYEKQFATNQFPCATPIQQHINNIAGRQAHHGGRTLWTCDRSSILRSYPTLIAPEDKSYGSSCIPWSEIWGVMGINRSIWSTLTPEKIWILGEIWVLDLSFLIYCTIFLLHLLFLYFHYKNQIQLVVQNNVCLLAQVATYTIYIKNEIMLVKLIKEG